MRLWIRGELKDSLAGDSIQKRPYGRSAAGTLTSANVDSRSAGDSVLARNDQSGRVKLTDANRDGFRDINLRRFNCNVRSGSDPRCKPPVLKKGLV